MSDPETLAAELGRLRERVNQCPTCKLILALEDHIRDMEECLRLTTQGSPKPSLES